MVTIKSYTDLQQSKKLAEILPHESADMYYFDDNGGDPKFKVRNSITYYYYDSEDCLPCWSLAALLDVMICPNLEKYIEGVWDLTVFTDNTLKTPIEVQDCKNPVDACYEMIVKLHELKML